MVTKTIDLGKSSASLEEPLALLELDTEIILLKGNAALAALG